MATPGNAAGLAGGPIGQALAPVSEAFQKVFDVTKVLVPGLQSLTNAFNLLTTPFSNFVTIAATAADAIARFGSSIAGLVAKANPVVAEQFTLALNDTLAVIGQALMPVLQVVTQLMRLFGDAIASFSGELGSVLGEIAQALMPIFELMAEALAISGKVISAVLQFVMPAIRFIVEGIRTIFDWWIRLVKDALSFIGIEIGDSAIKKGASVGAAVRSASTGDVEGVLRKARESALSLGAASGPNYAEMTANNTEQLLIRAGSIADKIGRIIDIISKPVEAIDDAVDALTEMVEGVVDRAAGKDMGGTVRGAVAGAMAPFTLTDLAMRTAGFGPLGGERARGDGPGTVKGGAGAVGGGG